MTITSIPVAPVLRIGSLLTRSLAASVVTVMTLTGCGSLYLHSEATQKVTQEAKTEFDKLKTAAVFDNEVAYLKELEARENAAVARTFSAQRDDSLIKMLRGTGPGGSDGRTFMASRIDRYLTALTHTSDRGDGAKLWRVVHSAHEKGGDGAEFAIALEEGLKSPGVPIKPIRSGIEELRTPSGMTLKEAIEAVKVAAAARVSQQQETAAAQKTLATELAKVTENLKAGKSSRESYEAYIGKLNEFLNDAKERSNPYLGQYISESLGESLDKLIGITDPKDLNADTNSTARAALGFVSAALGVGDAFSEPPRVPHPNALAVAKAQLQYTAARANAQLAQAKANEEVLHAQLLAVSRQVYYLSRAGEALTPIANSPKLETDQGFATLLTSNDEDIRHAANAALYYYAAAWTQGFTPAQQLGQVAVHLVERRGKLQQSRLSAEAWEGALKPAVATLAAYGEGGIDPHVLAELLQVLGIGAIAVGVN